MEVSLLNSGLLHILSLFRQWLYSFATAIPTAADCMSIDQF